MARRWAEIEALEPTEAERKLIEACRKGEHCVLGDGIRPETPDPTRTIRAEILRYLILGGCEGCLVHEWGVQLTGAWIEGGLDLSFATATGPVGLIACRFSHPLTALSARFDVLNLSGSRVPELNSQNVDVKGDVFLRDGFKADGEVCLFGALIGGQMDCRGGKFRNAGGNALNAQGADVKGEVFLHDGFKADGVVSLSGVLIGGQLDCSGGKFRNADGDALNAQGADVTGDVFLRDGFKADGEVNLSGASIGGQLACIGGKFGNTNGYALNTQAMTVSKGFIWRNVSVSAGDIYLASARVQDLIDDLESWPTDGRLYLDGFAWQRMSGKAFLGVADRLEWLRRGAASNGKFFPQPYAQLAKVYREMGHDSQARDVLVEQGRLVRFHAREEMRIVPNGDVDVAFRSIRADLRILWLGFWGLMLRWVVGYGYRPFRSLWWLLGLWITAASLGSMAWDSGAMVPASARVLASAEWQAVVDGPNPAAAWVEKAGRDWEPFSAAVWGLEVAVPAFRLWQVEAWAPSWTRGFWGQAAWWGRWVISILGWIVAGLFAAAVTGIIKRE